MKSQKTGKGRKDGAVRCQAQDSPAPGPRIRFSLGRVRREDPMRRRARHFVGWALLGGAAFVACSPDNTIGPEPLLDASPMKDGSLADSEYDRASHDAPTPDATEEMVSDSSIPEDRRAPR